MMLAPYSLTSIAKWNHKNEVLTARVPSICPQDIELTFAFVG